MAPQNKSRAFTLIEILIVISIIAILAGLLFPVIRMVRDSALTAKCGSNLRQIGLAFVAYAGDNNNHFPVLSLSPMGNMNGDFYTNLLDRTGVLEVRPDDWHNKAYGDAWNGVWRCPTVTQAQLSWGGGYGILDSAHGFSYVATTGSRFTTWTRATERALVCDTEVWDGTYNMWRTWAALNCPLESDWSTSQRASARHANRTKTNVVFADCHVHLTLWTGLRDNLDDVWRHDSP